MPAENSVDPGYGFLLSAVGDAFSENDLCTLIAAAAEDRWLVDSAAGSVRVMDDEGHEANRASRDPQMWTASAVDGCYVVMYGPRGVALVRKRLGDLAPPEEEMPHIEAEKVELTSTSVEGLAKHRYKLAWRLQWIEQEQRFRLQQSDIPQLWWAVAQNVIVPLKVLELERKYPDVYGEVLKEKRSNPSLNPDPDH